MRTEPQQPRRSRLAILAALTVLAVGCASVPAFAAAGDTAASTAGITAGRQYDGPEHARRGTIVWVQPIDRLSQAEAAQQIADRGYSGPAPRFGVDNYRVLYRTVDPQGRPTTASGLVSLPERDQRALSTVVYEHGTTAARSQAPSASGTDQADAVLFAGAGYATVAPDYLGLGSGPGPHPYADTVSEATASVDLLRAARDLAHRHGHSLERGVQVTGFSQGGPAAMALGRALQQGVDPHFELVSLAPISGPYDAQHAEAPAGLVDDTLRGRDTNYYFGYWLTAMNREHHLYDSPSELFQAPYDQQVESLYDGSHTDAEIFAALPDDPRAFLTQHAIDWALHPTGELLRAFRANDTTCTDWVPEVPVQLFAADGDKDVAYPNSEHCFQALSEHGAQVTLTDVGPVEHSPSRRAALPQVAALFAERLPA
ncbi:alpha/beta hydrolase family protein [Kitasatospora azatica]|uniref:alpha/beta hydrolase family protein n=1 Tax=Kitasatospora azatica TaxID=58347 RepID=UPI00055B4DC5|nr:lipase family protein [Kitasatospora azatica]